MKRVIEYEKLKAFLIQERKYSEGEAICLLAELRRADKETLAAFWKYYSTGELPSDRIHGLRIKDLMELRHMNEYAAFLTIAWKAREPLRAAWQLMNPIYSEGPGEKTLGEIRAVARKNNWDIGESTPEEDTSDIEVDID